MSKSIQKKDNGNNRNGYEEISTFSLPNQEQSSGGLDPKLIVFTIFRYKWLILLFLILGGVGAWYYADTIPPEYEGRGTMMITTSNQGSSNELSRIINQTTGGGMNATLANEMQVIQSRSFARQIARKLTEDDEIDISELPAFWRENEDGSVDQRNIDGAANAIRSGLSVLLVNRDADIIELRFNSSSPYETATMVNAAMEVYVEESTIQNRQAADSTTDFLENERSELQQKLTESEQRLKDFMDRTGIVRVDNQASSAVSRIEQLQAEIEDAQLDLESVELAIKSQEEELERIRPGLLSDFTDAVAPRIRSYQDALSEYERERYLILSNYPNVRQREVTPPRLEFLDKQIEDLKEQIAELSGEIFSEKDEYMGMESAERTRMVTDIQNQLVNLRMQRDQYLSRIQVLTVRKRDADESFEALPTEMIQLAQLQREVEMNEQLYLNVSQKYADMATWRETQYGNGRIIDLAIIPGAPISPNKILILMMGIILSGMFAGFIILVREFFDNSISSIGAIKTQDLPMLAAIPAFKKIPTRNGSDEYKVGKGKIPNEMVLFRDRSSIVSESIRRLKNNIIFQNSDNIPKTIAITSSEKGEGKSTVACNLAVAFADEGYKTLIIDTDFRRPRVHTLFGLSNNKGMNNLIQGESSTTEIIQSTEIKYLKVISAGSNIQRPESLVNHKNFTTFLEKMDKLFDVIIMDTPPFGIISDSTSLLRKADATVMVAKYRKTNKEVYMHTLDELRRINANVCGMVLNDFDPGKDPAGHYGAGYYKSLYGGYGEYA